MESERTERVAISGVGRQSAMRGNVHKMINTQNSGTFTSEANKAFGLDRAVDVHGWLGVSGLLAAVARQKSALQSE